MRTDEAEFPGVGLTDGRALTDAEGRFRMGGLRPGHYAVLVVDADGLMGRKPPQRYCQTGETVPLVLDLHRLRVRVLDEQGRPVPGASLLFFGGHESRPGLRVEEATGAMDLVVRPGAQYMFQADVPGFSPAKTSLTIPEQPRETPLDLVLKPTPPGQLRLKVQDPQGEPIIPMLFAVYDRDTNLQTLRNTRESGSPESIIGDLPSGRYRLQVVPGLPGHGFWLPLREEIEIRPDGETQLLLRADRQGGRLRLVVRVPEERRAGQTVQLIIEALRPGSRERTASEVDLRRPSGSVVKKVGLNPEGFVEHDREDPYVTTLLLEPGPYDLLVWAEGYGRFERPIQVVEGQLQEIEVPLVPK